MKMRVYLLYRYAGLPVMTFSTLKKARDWSRSRFPFCVRWVRAMPFGAGKVYRQWVGFDREGLSVATIVSTPLDEGG